MVGGRRCSPERRGFWGNGSPAHPPPLVPSAASAVPPSNGFVRRTSLIDCRWLFVWIGSATVLLHKGEIGIFEEMIGKGEGEAFRVDIEFENP